MVLALKLALPEYVHLNRGNHEDEDLSFAYDFAAGMAASGLLVENRDDQCCTREEIYENKARL